MDLLYSYKCEEPAPLPSRIRLEDNTVLSSLEDLSPENLRSLGFVGPITKPSFDSSKQKIIWDGEKYNVIDLSKKELALLEQEEKREKLKTLRYDLFWQKFIYSGVYKKLRLSATQKLELNTLYTEIVSLFIDAKIGNPLVGEIQNRINYLFFIFDFTDEEIREFSDLMKETKLDIQYSLPDKEYLSSHTYDPISNTVTKNSPFKSWKFIDGQWKAPTPYPSDGKVYNWNEDIKNWIEI